MAAPAHTTGLTYDDLASFPEDNLRRELIGGELVVTPAPRIRHQDVVTELAYLLRTYTTTHGGKAFVAPTDVVLSESDVVEPDLLYVAPDHVDRLTERFVAGAPDIAVEVSSPSTRRLELVAKRELYERHGVAEYWYIDLDVDRVEIYRLQAEGRYGAALLLVRGEALTSPRLPGFEVAIDDLLGAAE